MRLFNALIFDSAVEGTLATYTDPKWNDFLGKPDKLKLFMVADGVSGTSPTITVAIEDSGDNRWWVPKNGSPEFNNVALNTSNVNFFSAFDAGTVPNAAYVRLRVQLGGTSPKARVRIYVTGRGEDLEAVLPAATAVGGKDFATASRAG